MIRIILAALLALVSSQAVAQIEPGALIAKNRAFYVMDPVYGGFCNRQTVSGVTTTAGSNVVSSSGYTFQSSDVGKLISVTTGVGVGPGVGGLAYNGVIGSVSGGSANLVTTVGGSTAQNSTSSVGGSGYASFGNDDAPAFIAASAAASAAGGGTVQLPGQTSAGNGCIVSSYILVPSKVSYNGLGATVSLIKWISVGDMPHGVFSDQSDISNVYTGCTAAIAASETDNHFTNFEIDASSATLNTGYQVDAKGISMPCAQRTYIDHIYVHDTPATAIATDFAFGTVTTNNYVVNGGRLGGQNPGSSGIGDAVLGLAGEAYLIANNLIINPAHYGIFVEGQTSGYTAPCDAVVSGNIIIGGLAATTATYGGVTTNTAAIGANCSGMVITGNTIDGGAAYSTSPAMSWNGIAVDTGTLNYSVGTEATIANNRVINTNNGIAVYLVESNEATTPPVRTTISGNLVKGSVHSGITIFSGSSVADLISINNNISVLNGSAGISLQGAGGFKNVQIMGNKLVGNGQISTSPWVEAGIGIGTTVSNIQITGNMVLDDGYTKQLYALATNAASAVTGADIEGNDWSGYTSTYGLQSTMTGVVRNNVGDPTFSIVSGSANTPVGGPDIGTLKTTAAGASTIVLRPFGTSQIVATTGYACQGSDMTAGITLVQTAMSTTSVSLAMPAGASSGDTAQFSCRMF